MGLDVTIRKSPYVIKFFGDLTDQRVASMPQVQGSILGADVQV